MTDDATSAKKKFALLIKVYMNMTVRQMAPLQQANVGNIPVYDFIQSVDEDDL